MKFTSKYPMPSCPYVLPYCQNTETFVSEEIVTRKSKHLIIIIYSDSDQSIPFQATNLFKFSRKMSELSKGQHLL